MRVRKGTNRNRCAIYARFSTTMQNKQSADDQIRVCREYAQRKGWTVVATYKDEAKSGASMVHRDELQALLAAAKRGEFDIVLAESQSRLARHARDNLDIFGDLEDLDIALETLSEGEASFFTVAVLGAAAQKQLRDNADQTWRGQESSVLQGRHMGRVPFGYRRVEKFEGGKPVKGLIEIDPEEAKTVRAIFEQFVAGLSLDNIANKLNAAKVLSPAGKVEGWSDTSLYGTKKGGILSNQIYIGRPLWNRQKTKTNSKTDRRMVKFRDESEWVETKAPHLRIISDKLWEEAQARRNRQRAASGAIRAAQGDHSRTGRPGGHIFAGLLFCATCGATFTKRNATHFCCSSRKHRGKSTCSNAALVSQKLVEEKLLRAIKHDLFAPDLLAKCKAEFRQWWADQTATSSKGGEAVKKSLSEVDRKIGFIVGEIEAGSGSATLRARLASLEVERANLERQAKQPALPSLDIGAAWEGALSRYKSVVPTIQDAQGPAMSRIREQVGKLVGGKIVVRPHPDGSVTAEVTGNYAGLFEVTCGSRDRSWHSRARISAATSAASRARAARRSPRARRDSAHRAGGPVAGR